MAVASVDWINEYFAIKPIANNKTPIKKKSLISLFFNFEKLSIRKIKINNDVIQNNNCGLGELTRKKVIGHAKIDIKNNLFCAFLKKIGINDSKDENCIIPPNCSAPSERPKAKGISPRKAKFTCIGNISF